MVDTSHPALSVVMVTTDTYDTCRQTVSFLKRQTRARDIELVIVAPSAKLTLEPGLDDVFFACRVVEIDEVLTNGEAIAAGVRQARAPVIAYGEEHSYPAPDWADILIEAHEEPYPAIGCAMANHNPDTYTSWAHFYAQFGPVVEPAESGVQGWLGGHHTTYKRDVLLAYGPLLGQLLDNENAIYGDLRARGEELFLAGGAVSSHVQVSIPRAYFRLEYRGQRGFAAARAAAGHWSRTRRVLYGLASPLVPMIRMRRILGHVRRTGRSRELLPQMLVILVPGLLSGAVGEAVGYLFGDRSPEDRIDIELDRFSFVTENDRTLSSSRTP